MAPSSKAGTVIRTVETPRTFRQRAGVGGEGSASPEADDVALIDGRGVGLRELARLRDSPDPHAVPELRAILGRGGGFANDKFGRQDGASLLSDLAVADRFE
jgi:hypothetical protein